jgi:hypothetical protein
VAALSMERGSTTCSKRSVASNGIIHTVGMEDRIPAICMYLLLFLFSTFTSIRTSTVLALFIHFHIHMKQAIHVFKVRINMIYA